MKPIIQYEPNGKIYAILYGTQEQFYDPAHYGLHIIGEADIDYDYIDGGKVVRKPPQPSQHHVFDHDSKQWVDHRTPETEWLIVRNERNKRLSESDWTQLPDVPLATKEAWQVYRQALRDITNQPDPFTIIWPTPPGA